MELRNDLTNLCGNRFRIRDARPTRIDPFKKRIRHRLTFQQFEIFFSRSASRRAAHALAFVHTETGGRDFRVRFSEKRIVTARFQNGQTRWIERKNGDVFQTSRVARQGFTKTSCSGKRFGSPAAENASRARMADAV